MLWPRNNRCRPHAVRVVVLILSLGAAGLSSGQVVNTKAPDPTKKIEGMATWYSVPAKSRTKLRAAKGELTAAHNRLPYGTRVRVTHLANGKSVVVRITDRGVYKRGTIIDLSKEAAAQLDMLREGSAHVQLEILPDDKASPSKTKTAPW